MFNKAQILDTVKTRLGYPVIDLAMTDEMLMKQIDFAVAKVIPYLNNVEILTVNTQTDKFNNK